MKVTLSHKEVYNLAFNLSKQIDLKEAPGAKIYAIPRGGVPIAYLVKAHSRNHYEMVEYPEDADFFIDDTIDSGNTRDNYKTLFPNKPFYALIDKEVSYTGQWVIFPWESEERMQDNSIVGTITNRLIQSGSDFSATSNVNEWIMEGELSQLTLEVQKRSEHLLRALLINIDSDQHTQETGKRIAKMFINEIFAGRYTPPPELTFFHNYNNLDEMYVTGPISIRSTCAHHFQPIVGKCWIGIIPGNRLMGLSKFNRIVEWMASRPTIQEELVELIAAFLELHLQPRGLAVSIEATHMCLTQRGVKEHSSSIMTTNVLRGAFKTNPETRAEFFSTIARQK